ncbi:hypothetical protein [Streptomyces sp. NPDC007988]|uniref:hypothetical protein n=1 Tax=Streptomyces sp. NPDC007988 TaxID=3364802 RepID=UPI0036E17B00
MSNIEEDFNQLQSRSRPEIEPWLAQRFPDGATVQWWCAVFESVETSVSRFRGITPEQLLNCFERGSYLIELAVERNEILPTIGSYWLLRLADSTAHFDFAAGELPEPVTPDGAAKWALARMPLTRQEAKQYADRRAAEFAEADEVFYASLGVTDPEFEPIRQDTLLLQEVERVLTALSWIRGRVSDMNVRAEVDAWLDAGSSFQ